MRSMQQILNACGLSDWNTYRGLLWHEWHKQKRVHQVFLGIFILLIATSGIYQYNLLMLFALYYACFAGLLSVNNPGNDEFYFSLPPVRKQIFLTQCSMGFLPMLLMLLIWTVLNPLNLRAISYTISLALLVYCLFFAYALPRKNKETVIIALVIAGMGYLNVIIDERLPVRNLHSILFLLVISIIWGGCCVILYLSYQSFSQRDIHSG